MSSFKAEILDISGEYTDTPDFPVAVVKKQDGQGIVANGLIVDPIFNTNVTDNLYGRIMTLVEATTDSYKLKAVKDLFSKELRDWQDDVYGSARHLAKGINSSDNLYTKSSRL